MSTVKRLVVVYRLIIELLLGENCRLHSHRQIRQIADSIKAFGFNVPILIDAEFEGYRRPRKTPSLPDPRMD